MNTNISISDLMKEGGGGEHHVEPGFIQHTSTLSFFLAILAIYSILSEKGVVILLRYFERKQKFLVPMLEAVIAQLMLLGLFSFLFFVANKVKAIQALQGLLKEETEVIVEMAEIVHFLVFIGLIIYVGTITTVVIISVSLVRNWSRNETSGLGDVVDRYHDLRLEKSRRGCCAYLNPIFLYRILDMRYAQAYHLLRADFIRHNKLKKDYNFASYLKRCIGHCFQELAEIHWSNWVLLLFIILVNWVRYELVLKTSPDHKASTTMHPEFWGAMSGAFLFGAFLLYLKCQWILYYLSEQAKERLREANLLPSGLLPTGFIIASGELPSATSSQMLSSETIVIQSDDDIDVDDGEHVPLIQSINTMANAVASDQIRTAKRKHKKLFWFNRPNLLFRLIQLLLLFQSWFVALLVIFLPNEKLSHWTISEIVFCFLPSFVTALGFAPLVLPIFTLIRFVDVYTRKELIYGHGEGESHGHGNAAHNDAHHRDNNDNTHGDHHHEAGLVGFLSPSEHH